MNEFNNCLNSNNQDRTEALGCCLSRCNSNECQETCIKSYNSNIIEGFLLGRFFERRIVFLILVLITNGIIMKKSHHENLLILKTSILYIFLYFLSNYI